MSTLSHDDLNTLLQTNMNTPLSPTLLTSALYSPPFIPLPSSLNLRDLGLLPSSLIPPNLILRSGSISSIPSSSLASLNISMILDLRSKREVDARPDPMIEGVAYVWVDSDRKPKKIEMAKYAEGDGVEAYADMYMEILEIYAGAWKKGLEWVLKWKQGDGGMVVHCTAGKDRTGVFAALVSSLTGASRELIAYDYALTRIGVEPQREMLSHMLMLWNKEWTPDTPGMAEFVQVKGEFILAFLDKVEEMYGGVEMYVRNVLGFVEKDVEVMKRVLRGESER